MKKKKDIGTISNKRARFDYSIEDTLVAGIALTGPETKSLRMGHGILRGAYVQIKDSGAQLVNLQINPLLTNAAHMPEDSRSRTRQLLLKAKEIAELREQKTAGRQIVPLRLLTKGRFIKVELGIGKGKKNYDKRQSIKRRDQERLEQSRFKR